MAAERVNDTGSPIWTHGSTEVCHTGAWRTQIPAYINPPAPCHSACPVDGNIALWIQHVKEKDYHGAWVTLADNNPYPAIAGIHLGVRRCYGLCEIH